MIKTLLKSVREYKKPAIVTPIFMVIEALCECLIPFFMAQLITAIDPPAGSAALGSDQMLNIVLQYGAILIVLAAVSLTSGVLAGRFAATASCGFAKNLRHDLFNKVQRFSFAN
ncbi:MAG: ABC transporter ATP-binding protein, partial [Clostridia bacterium]|nr:ABC transporter ATP-binding protein [Clostridia bacterium]